MGAVGDRRTIREYDYVDRPYEPVRDALREGALSIFQRATSAAEERSEHLVSALSVDLAEVQFSKDIEITIRGIDEGTTIPGSELSRVTHVALEWQAAASPSLFPAMKAELTIYPLSHTETLVELVGTYDPSTGVLGDALDEAVGHRVAEASVHRFVRAVVERLSRDLG